MKIEAGVKTDATKHVDVATVVLLTVHANRAMRSALRKGPVDVVLTGRIDPNDIPLKDAVQWIYFITPSKITLLSKPTKVAEPKKAAKARPAASADV